MNRGKNSGIGRTFQKPKNRKYALKRLWDYLYKYKFLLLIALTLTILSNSFALVGPKLLGYAINAMDFKITGGKVLIDKVLYYAMLMVVFYIFSSIFSYILSRLMIKIGKKVVYQMRADAFNKLQELPVKYFDTNTTAMAHHTQTVDGCQIPVIYPFTQQRPVE